MVKKPNQPAASATRPHKSGDKAAPDADLKKVLAKQLAPALEQGIQLGFSLLNFWLLSKIEKSKSKDLNQFDLHSR